MIFCTSAPHVFAAGDVTGRMMLVPQAIQQGFVAATNAVQGATMTLLEGAAPIGSFTDPEYAQVGMTEKQARAAGEIRLKFVSTRLPARSSMAEPADSVSDR